MSYFDDQIKTENDRRLLHIVSIHVARTEHLCRQITQPHPAIKYASDTDAFRPSPNRLWKRKNRRAYIAAMRELTHN